MSACQSSLPNPPDLLTSAGRAPSTDIPMDLSWNERRKLNRYLKQDDKAEAKRVKEQEKELQRQDKAVSKEWKKSQKAEKKETKKLQRTAKYHPSQSQTAYQPTRPLPHPFPTNTDSFTKHYLPVNGPLGAADYPAPMLPSLAAFGVGNTGAGHEGHGTVMSRTMTQALLDMEHDEYLRFGQRGLIR